MSGKKGEDGEDGEELMPSIGYGSRILGLFAIYIALNDLQRTSGSVTV